MPSRHIRLFKLSLGYSGGLMLHTAGSGAVPTLEELRLVVERDGELEAVGSTRINISYLSGVPAEAVEAAVIAAFDAADWSCGWPQFIGGLDKAFPAMPAAARMLFEMAAADGEARQSGRPLALLLDASQGALPPATETNQTLFWQDDESLARRADDYAARGFLQLKLRIGIATFDDDLRRLKLLRHRLPGARLSVDANGQWDRDSAPARLRALADLGAEYVEQPLAAADWDGTAALSAQSPVPIMLDESLSSLQAIEKLATTRAAPLAHLKLAKLGGIDRLMQAGKRLEAAGIGVMVGQMNEGIVSTLAAAHSAVALKAPFRELYGSDHLTGDLAEPVLRYAEGLLHLPQGPGLGVTHHPIPSTHQLLRDIAR
jgi:L-alanine-DL-glutamate epimerase-like enolase superfamily enzyme